MLKFREKQSLLLLIDEYHWHKGSRGEDHLYIFVSCHNMESFMRYFSTFPFLFDDEGIEIVWKGLYVCIPDFEQILDRIGESWEDIRDMFNEEQS